MNHAPGEPWLQQGEQVVLHIAANHSEGGAARGGKLWVTNQRLLFQPHGLDRSLGAGSVNIPLSRITRVGKEAPDLGPQGLMSGGLRTRLRVETVEGARFLFVVNRLDEVIAQIRAVAPDLPAPPDTGPQAPAGEQAEIPIPPHPRHVDVPQPPPGPPSQPYRGGYVSHPTRSSSLALILEIVPGLIGLPGIGWLYAGNVLVGVLLLVGTIVWDLFAIGVAFGTVFISCLCTVPINLAIAGISAAFLYNYTSQHPELFQS